MTDGRLLAANKPAGLLDAESRKPTARAAPCVEHANRSAGRRLDAIGELRPASLPARRVSTTTKDRQAHTGIPSSSITLSLNRTNKLLADAILKRFEIDPAGLKFVR